MENAHRLKSILKKQGIAVNLQIKPDHYKGVLPYPKVLHRKTKNIITSLNLKNIIMTSYHDMFDRNIFDMYVGLTIPDSDPQEEFMILTNTYVPSDKINYSILFPDKGYSLKEFLKQNEFIASEYETIETIFKNCLELPADYLLHERVSFKTNQQQIRFRSHDTDPINATNRIVISGNEEDGYRFTLRLDVSKNPNATYKAIIDSRKVVDDFFKKK